jgi:hypothetical protein
VQLPNCNERLSLPVSELSLAKARYQALMHFLPQFIRANSQRVSREHQFDCQLLATIDSDPFFSLKVELKKISLRFRQVAKALSQAPIFFFELFRWSMLRLNEGESLLLFPLVFLVNKLHETKTAPERIAVACHHFVNSYCDAISNFVGERFSINTAA